jgi:hypothetical protein
MSKALRVLIILAIVLLAIPLRWMWSHRSRHQGALAKYKAELRAMGEKLTWAELGYPRRPEASNSLLKMLTAVDKIGPGRTNPGKLGLMSYVGPGRSQPCWASVQPQLATYYKGANAPTWVEFESDYESAQAALEEIRASLQNPARYFLLDPTNFLNWPKYPFVQQRNAAQWLVGDSIVALHSKQLDRAQADLHALTQLTHLHKEDPTLVNQMIRVAIAGLGLVATWEALQANGWNDETLAALQKDWEGVELFEALNRGLQGERIIGETYIEWLRQDGGSSGTRNFGGAVSPAGTATLNSLEDYFGAYVVTPLWRVNSEDDELFLLQHYQSRFEFLRKLDGVKPWSETAAEFKAYDDKLSRITGSHLGQIRYQVSGHVIPNISKATLITVRNETLRRLTVTAIALERYRLRHDRPPADLAALVPELLRTVPLDPMSGRPLGYRFTAGASFALYSVGEDGRDDGGDPTSLVATNRFDLWSGKDALWPTGVINPP